ncbi:arsenate reductase ArsC [Emcibacter nanhaiensis]|uniref:Arsenate reductase ArsC n=1 Tax=Emcibacter nanhaiensis TaxID=1505037 RepID=A0A501PG34_9PROT|nr:arsenate reductase ArsC [Emcibacter nanhaiensis]TPD58924.1 arsenate reductase ArsC [Emcibacter nanhaiensis]
MAVFKRPPLPELPARLPADEIHSVLFMCNFNSIRSPMAEALTRHYVGHRIFVASAGIRPETDEINPFAAAVMEEVGLDISDHIPKGLDQLEDSSFDLIISLSPEAHHTALEWTRTMACEVEYWPTLDPTLVSGNRELILEEYRKVREMLKDRILERFDVTPSPGL